MFRHKNSKQTKAEAVKDINKDDKVKSLDKSDDELKLKEKTKTNIQSSDESVKELLEKNLKWSQIIYEQNRRINHKLLWSAIAGWLRLVLILAPLILALFYLSPLVKQVWQSYNSLLGITPQSGFNQKTDSLDNLFKVFNLDEIKQNQIKNVLQ